MIELDRIYNIDCVSGMSEMDPESVDFVMCDPPYTISRKTNFSKSKKKGKDTDRFMISMEFGKWDEDGSFDIIGMISGCEKVLRNGGYMVCFYDIWKIGYLKRIMESFGFSQIRFIEWVKTNPVPINSRINYLTNAREVAVCCVKGSSPVFNSVYDNGIYEYPICHEKGRFHPTQKPVELISGIMEKHSNPGDVVLDCCIGSGTTAISAIRKGRHFIGFETDESYFRMANERIEEELHSNSLKLF